MADEYLDERVPRPPDPGGRRVRSRAASLAREERPEGVEDPEKQAAALLADSDAREDLDPAPRTLKEDRVERRTSEEATPPPEPGL